MNESVVKNRSGWTLHEYIDVPEDRISEYPNVTGAYAIVKVGDRYLIGYNAWRKQWEFPAGGIEEGETARQAAVRELYEETLQDDVALEFKGLFKVTDSHGKQKYQAVFLGKKDELKPFVYSEGDEMSKIQIWDLKEDIGYVDELDVAIVKKIGLGEQECRLSRIELTPMTAEMYHLFFSEYENDPDLFLPGQEYVHYEYSVEKVVKYIQKQKDLNRIPLAIMCDDEIAGEILIKNIEAKKSATMSIVLKNSKYKGHGIGTQAEQLAVQYVFGNLDIPMLYADTIKQNVRSQHVLEKVGFALVREDQEFKYYRIDRA